MTATQLALLQLIQAAPGRTMTAREIHGCVGRECNKATNAALKTLETMGLLVSQATNNRTLGTRWTATN
jgi:Fe2+ or Zn2+ uptake regulation protein